MPDVDELDKYEVTLEVTSGFWIGKDGTWEGWHVRWRRRGSRKFSRFNLIGDTVTRHGLALAIRENEDD